MQIFVFVCSILKSFCIYKTKNKSIFAICWCERISIPQGSHTDLNFKSSYKCKSSRCLREIKYNQQFLFMSDKACMEIFQEPIF